jgi:hypothetical protein
MTSTSILHIASSLLLVPYGFLCAYGIKEKLYADVSETELDGEEQGTFVAWFDRLSVARRLYSNFTALFEVRSRTVHAECKCLTLAIIPRVVPLGSERNRGFLLRFDRVVSELIRAYSFSWYHFEVTGLIAGAVGAVGSWLPNGFYFYVCNYLLAISAMFFFIMVPYFLESPKKQHRQSAPLLAAAIGSNALAIVIRVGMLEAPYDTKHFGDLFHWYIGSLFAYCVLANIIVSYRARRSKAAQTHKRLISNSSVLSTSTPCSTVIREQV